MSDPVLPLQTQRLPRGPHSMSRKEVAESQRTRLLLGMAEAVAEKGWGATTITDVTTRAGVSRATYYQLYDDKLSCFLEACKVASELMLFVLEAELAEIAKDTELGTMGRVERLVDRYLESLSETPGFARAFLVEVYAAGPEAVAERLAMIDRFTDLVAASGLIDDEYSDEADDRRALAEVVVQAISSAVTNAVAVGELDRFESLRNSILRVASQFTQQR